MPFRDADSESCGVKTGSADWALAEGPGDPARNGRKAAESLSPRRACGHVAALMFSAKRLKRVETRRGLRDVCAATGKRRVLWQWPRPSCLSPAFIPASSALLSECHHRDTNNQTSL